MIIRALRIADLGPFSDGVALEGLSGRLDVLVGANEFGKSSLFRALLTLVEEKHTASSARVTRLRHGGGGAPLIEADIDVAGRRWRIRKRFLVQRMAMLQNLDTGQTVSGADAENRLEELLSPAGLGGAHRRLLWVGQTESFALPAGATLAAPLSALIEREAAEATGSGLARRVAAAITADLAQLQTAHRPPRPSGTLKAAIEANTAARTALDGARERAAGAAARRGELADLRREAERLACPGAAAATRRAVTIAQRALEEGARAREQLHIAADKLLTARQLEAAAVKSLTDFESLQTERQSCAAALETGEAEREEALRRQQDATARLVHLEHELVTLHRETETVRAQQRARAAADALLARTALNARLEAAAEADREINAHEAAAAANRVGTDQVAAARRLATAIAAAEAEARAGAAVLRMDYVPGAKVRLEIDGRAIDGGEEILALAPLAITVPSIGTLHVSPGRAAGADAATRAASLRGQQQAVLEAMGVGDLAAAEAGLAAAQRRTEALAAARARLAAVAPQGIAALEAEAARLASVAAAPSQGTEQVPERQAIEQHMLALEARRADLDRELAAARAAAALANESLIRIETGLAGRQQRLIALDAELTTDEQGRHRALSAAAAAARAAHADTRAGHERWAAITPDAVAFAQIQSELERAKAAEAQREAKLFQLSQSIAKLEGELGRDDAEGVGAELIRLEEQAAAAAAHLTSIEREAAALNLLLTRLQAAETQHRGTTLRPLSERLAPLVARLLPDATGELGGVTSVAAIVRKGRAEPFAQLSDGTREQIAVLVRLAWAGLLAERDAPSPLILDDALVYSDDDRLARTFMLLAEAAANHQVLVLSCHAKATRAAAEAAGATMLTLQPWQSEMPRATAAGRV